MGFELGNLLSEKGTAQALPISDTPQAGHHVGMWNDQRVNDAKYTHELGSFKSPVLIPQKIDK
jgi:hypothetical protein